MQTKLYSTIHKDCGGFILNCSAAGGPGDDKACAKPIPADQALIRADVMSTDQWGGEIFCSQSCADRQEAYEAIA